MAHLHMYLHIFAYYVSLAYTAVYYMRHSAVDEDTFEDFVKMFFLHGNLVVKKTKLERQRKKKGFWAKVKMNYCIVKGLTN